MNDDSTSYLSISRLALSALIVLVAEPLYLLEDLAVVGRLGVQPLAALGVGTVVLGVVSTQLTFLSYGTTARAARWFGRGDRSAAVEEGVSASWLAVALGLVIAAVVGVLAEPIVRVVASDGAVAADAAGWLQIAVCGVPMILLSMAGNGWMRGVRDTRRPVVYVSTGLGLSAVLCPLLVHGLLGVPDLGLHGSAVANLVGQSVAGLLFVSRLVGECRRAGSAVSPWPLATVIRAQVTLARDLILRSLSFQVCFLSAAAVAARFGVAALAAHQVVLQVWNFLALVLDAVAIAAQSLVGAALGAGAASTALRVARRVTVISVAGSVVALVVLAVLRVPITRIISGNSEVLGASATPWWFLVVMLPVLGVVFALDGVLLGAGDAAYLRTTTVVGALVGFLPTIWASLAFDWGLAGIWSGLSAFMVVRLVAVTTRVVSGRWTRIELAGVGR